MSLPAFTVQNLRFSLQVIAARTNEIVQVRYPTMQARQILGRYREPDDNNINNHPKPSVLDIQYVSNLYPSHVLLIWIVNRSTAHPIKNVSTDVDACIQTHVNPLLVTQGWKFMMRGEQGQYGYCATFHPKVPLVTIQTKTFECLAIPQVVDLLTPLGFAMGCKIMISARPLNSEIQQLFTEIKPSNVAALLAAGSVVTSTTSADSLKDSSASKSGISSSVVANESTPLGEQGEEGGVKNKKSST